MLYEEKGGISRKALKKVLRRKKRVVLGVFSKKGWSHQTHTKNIGRPYLFEYDVFTREEEIC